MELLGQRSVNQTALLRVLLPAEVSHGDLNIVLLQEQPRTLSGMNCYNFINNIYIILRISYAITAPAIWQMPLLN